MHSEKSLKSTSRIEDIIITPTRISAGAVAADGIARNTGAKNSAIAKQIATVNDVRPVRPPSATPDALSTYVVVVLVPQIAPHTVATASAIRTFFTPGMVPSGFIALAFFDTPITVPIVSNISMKRNVNTTISISHERMLWNSNLQKMGATEGTELTTPSNLVIPNGIPMIAVTMIPISIAPGTLRIIITEVITRPTMASRAGPLVIEPRVMIVPPSSTMIPAFTRPMKAPQWQA